MVADMRFLPNPYWDPTLRPLSGLDEPVRETVLARSGGGRLPRPLRGPAVRADRRLRPGGQAVPHHRHRLHRRAAPQRRDGRGARRPARPLRRRHDGRAPRPGSRVTAPAVGPGAAGRRLAGAEVVAMGGGHGLAASLSALRHVSPRLTGGGHRGRQRRLVGPAARRARRAAARRPAPGAGGAVRRRRLGPYLGERAAAPLPQRRRPARPRARQPAHRRAVGAARRRQHARAASGAHVAGLDWVGAAARRPRPGAADERRAARRRRPGARRRP